MELATVRSCSQAMACLRALAFALVWMCAACGGPVAAPEPPAGELIAVGGGPGGAGDACFNCHGFAGEGGDRVPRLAGLSSGYMSKQLRDYANGTRPDDVMTPIAQRMRAGDQRAVSDYYARLALPLATTSTSTFALYHDGDPERGLRACARCHGEGGAGRRAANPAIAGQPAAYTAEQLRRWKRSVRRNDARDVMGAAARALTDEEIEDLARYIEEMR
jgi:cytochrome c553